jgi:hypothetical protein
MTLLKKCKEAILDIRSNESYLLNNSLFLSNNNIKPIQISKGDLCNFIFILLNFGV